MSTNREIISDITNNLKGTRLDGRISKRMILSKLNDFAALYIRRENDQLRLWNYAHLWTTVDCIEMEQADSKNCCGFSFDNCSFMMKSVQELPELFTFKGGQLIREIYSMDRSQKFEITTPRLYKEIQNREFKNKNLKYAWLENNRIYIPDSQIKLISITGLFKDKSKAKKLSTCKDLNSNLTDCDSILDSDFICPDHLISTVKREVMQDLLNGFMRIPADENSNLDSNIKQGKI